ncbi:MAG: LysM peptidoglycan-binding domain-containing protein [Candidatus Woesearchaeota archaeon]
MEAFRYLNRVLCIPGCREYVTPKGDKVHLVPAYNPLDFIEVMGPKLQKNGETYSLVELGQVREQLREAYLETKDKLEPAVRQEMLSTYAASLRQIKVLEEQRQLYESRQQLEARVNAETTSLPKEDPQVALPSLLAQLDKSRYIAGIAAAIPSHNDHPQEYISTVVTELSTAGETYSATELKQIRDNLKQAYQKAKNSANTSVELSELLSTYRKALGKASYLEQQRKAVEGKDVTSILADEQKTVYERLVLVRSWLTAQEKDKLYSKAGFYTLNSVRQGVESLLEDKVQSGYVLDTASMNAYQRLQDQCTSIQDILVEKKGLTPDVLTIETVASPQDEEQLPEAKVIPFKRKPLRQRMVSGVKRAAVAAAAALTVACVFLGGSADIEERNAVSPGASLDAYVLTDAAPVVYNEIEREVPLVAPLQEEKVVTPSVEANVLPTAVKHVLKKRDTAWGLAGEYYLNHKRFGEILAANNNPNPRRLEVGTELVIPNAVPIAETSYVVQKGDNYWEIANTRYGDPLMHPEISRINKGKKLHPGITLVLPGTKF